MDILDSSPHISQLAVTPSFWGSQSDLWADIKYGHKNVRFGESIIYKYSHMVEDYCNANRLQT